MWFFIITFVRPGKVFRFPCLVALRRLDFVGIKIDAWRYCASSGLVVWSRMLIVTDSVFFYRGNYHIPVCLFLVPLIFSCPFFWTDISWLSSVMVHTSSHNTPNYINGAVAILGEMWICLACLLRPGRWSFSMCDDSIVIPYDSIAVNSFEIIKGAIIVVACFSRSIFSPESEIARVLLLG